MRMRPLHVPNHSLSVGCCNQYPSSALQSSVQCGCVNTRELPAGGPNHAGEGNSHWAARVATFMKK